MLQIEANGFNALVYEKDMPKIYELNEKFMNRDCMVYWGPIDRPPRKNETFKAPTKTNVKFIWIDCHGLALFKSDDIFAPMEVERLTLL